MSRALAAWSAGSAGPAPPAAYRRARAALATEWIKLRSLRSMLVTALLGAVASIAVADLASRNNAANWAHLGAVQRARFDPLDINLGFVVLAVVLFGVLGSLVVTNEYGSGLIRMTLAATPQRGLVLAAKAVLAGLAALALAAVITFTAFFTGQALLSGGHAPHVSLGDHGVLGHLIGAVCYLTAAALIGLFVGVLARSAAAAIPSAFGLLLVFPVLVNKIPPDALTRHTVPYIPWDLGNALWHSHGGNLVSPAVGELGLAAWVLVLAAVAAFSLRGRDA
jgi:ABC-2 type transport system permease protein